MAMSHLSEAGSVAQEICNAIASVLGVDVEIADERSVRVAGTGKYRSKVGCSLETDGVVYRQVVARNLLSCLLQ
ncbi:MAG: hypothetical protein ACPLPR_06795 [Bacillota bacterium]